MWLVNMKNNPDQSFNSKHFKYIISLWGLEPHKVHTHTSPASPVALILEPLSVLVSLILHIIVLKKHE